MVLTSSVMSHSNNKKIWISVILGFILNTILRVINLIIIFLYLKKNLKFEIVNSRLINKHEFKSRRTSIILSHRLQVLDLDISYMQSVFNDVFPHLISGSNWSDRYQLFKPGLHPRIIVWRAAWIWPSTNWTPSSTTS